MNPWGYDCNEFVEVVTDYLEGKLPGEDRARFEKHLELCGSCRDYLEQIRMTLAATGRLGAEELAPKAVEELLTVFRRWKEGKAEGR
ncbi:MAG TPA: zf-HC2 domain-containing protein [Candidatus Acidoferrales bacterium]|nr:zf-HC2 domain-containing protein [Candidatus Acidoferrales bacterium]